MTVGLRSWTTGFATRHADGPIVNGTRQGDRWSLAWKGGSTVLETDEAGARAKAEIVARLLAEAEPLREQYEQVLADIGRELREGDEPF